MSLNDSLADAISKINNASKALKDEVLVKKSKLLINLLEILKKYNYIGDYEIIEDNKQGLVKIQLINTINRCGVIKPRFPVKVSEIEKYERMFLPAKNFGILIVSSTEGLITQNEVAEKNKGGVLLAYCY